MFAQLTQVRDLAGEFGTWWRRELTAMVPAAVRRRFADREEATIAEVSGGTVRLARVAGAASGKSMSLSSADVEASGAEAARRLRAATGIDRDEVVIRVAEEQALVKTLDLPLAAEPTLLQTLALAIDSQTPFRADQVVFDGRVVTRDRAAGRLTVEWVILPRAVVEPAIELLKALGLDPVRAEVVGAKRRSVDLRSPEKRTSRSALAFKSTRILATVAAGLAVAVIVVPLYQRHAELAEVQQQIAVVKRDADAVAALRGEFEKISAENGFLAGLKRDTPSALKTIDALSRLLPDDTWLVELHSTGRQVRIVGFAASASKLIAMIEESATFSNARFRSPVTPDAVGSSERFDLGFEIAEEKR